MRYFSRTLCLYVIINVCNNVSLPAQTPVPAYDLVINGGRVIDPETGLDGIRNIGIKQNRIAAISTTSLQGRQQIDAGGLVVAPGFIDMHVHGRTNKEQEYQLHDGLTTALELEWGVENLKEWYATRQSKALINFGASVCWPFERFKAMDKYKDRAAATIDSTRMGLSGLEKLFNLITPSYADTLSAAETNQVMRNIRQSLAEGGIGIGVPVGYLKSTSAAEILQVFQLAAQMHTLVYSHVREPGIASIQEVIADAVLTGASLHIVHINSMALGNIPLALELLKDARKKGFDISTEVYPYTAASTLIQSVLFNEGWKERLGMDYKDLQWVATGERLNKESFDKYRVTGGAVVMHMMKPEWIRAAVSTPGVMIASDGMPYAQQAHPRTAGTFTRVLSKYVREEKALDLVSALSKMTLEPAQRLETAAPMMRFKGRLQVGMDADITIFDPATVQDKASFEKGLAFSEGVVHVIVNGIPVLKNGVTVNGIFPGQPILGKYKN